MLNSFAFAVKLASSASASNCSGSDLTAKMQQAKRKVMLIFVWFLENLVNLDRSCLKGLNFQQLCRK